MLRREARLHIMSYNEYKSRRNEAYLCPGEPEMVSEQEKVSEPKKVSVCQSLFSSLGGLPCVVGFKTQRHGERGGSAVKRNSAFSAVLCEAITLPSERSCKELFCTQSHRGALPM